jgi:hypothetical protein
MQTEKLPEPVEDKPIRKLTAADYWVIFRLPSLLNACRVLNLVVAYRYHDWLSLVPLLWVLHSAMMFKREIFVTVSLYFYLPLMACCYVFYYLINIDGLILYKNLEYPQFYNYGFYFF